MILVLTSNNGTGTFVARALEKLNIDAVCCGDKDIIGDISQYEAVFFTGDFAVNSIDCAKLAKNLCRGCADAEIPTVFDPTLNLIQPESYEVIKELASLCEVFVPSDEDAKALCDISDPEKIAEHFIISGTKKVVVTLDKKGAYYKSAKESGTTPTFRADKVVDTKGAGNAFAAGLISGIIEDIPLAEAVVRANACGCISIQKENEYYPDMSELREYMLSHRFAVDGCKEF